MPAPDEGNSTQSGSQQTYEQQMDTFIQPPQHAPNYMPTPHAPGPYQPQIYVPNPPQINAYIPAPDMPEVNLNFPDFPPFPDGMTVFAIDFQS